jgi:hypothetical protein
MKRTLTTYADLRNHARAFAGRHFELFILVGDAGVGKSRVVKHAVLTHALIIEGQITPFQLYRDLYHNRGKLVVIDDVDQLYTNRDAVRLLKCLCQTEKTKTVAWRSATTLLDQENIPRQFTTGSQVAIIANVWKASNANIEAVNDRGILLNFQPTVQEVHDYVGRWYKAAHVSDEVYYYIGQNLQHITKPSARDYINAQRLKDAKLDWREALHETWGTNPAMLAVAALLKDEELTAQQREQAFQEQKFGSRATFYRLVRKVKSAQGKA